MLRPQPRGGHLNALSQHHFEWNWSVQGPNKDGLGPGVARAAVPRWLGTARSARPTIEWNKVVAGIVRDGRRRAPLWPAMLGSSGDVAAVPRRRALDRTWQAHRVVLLQIAPGMAYKESDMALLGAEQELDFAGARNDEDNDEDPKAPGHPVDALSTDPSKHATPAVSLRRCGALVSLLVDSAGQLWVLVAAAMAGGFEPGQIHHLGAPQCRGLKQLEADVACSIENVPGTAMVVALAGEDPTLQFALITWWLCL
eukprot:Skav205830  [mRNA]  locus=scaffold160:110478:116664:- [translate_table: standard]